ncbi:hypothetical protein GF322_02325 [Candidatus Dependentiae bacterium]|nr:hypothetical protein [Candidatus Dependentiae bacterium]
MPVNFLDPEAKPKAISAEIYKDAYLGRAICFFNEHGRPILNKKYVGDTELSIDYRTLFEKYFNLEELGEIEDNSELKSCLYRG